MCGCGGRSAPAAVAPLVNFGATSAFRTSVLGVTPQSDVQTLPPVTVTATQPFPWWLLLLILLLLAARRRERRS